MSLEEIKSRIASLSPEEQSEPSAYLFHLRHAADPEFQERISSRLADTNRAHWLTPKEFERELDGK